MTDELVTALAPPTSTSACPVGAALDDGRPLRSPLTGLDAAAFAHPLDRQAIAALRRLKGFDWAVAKVIEWQHERPAHVLHSASSVRVNAKQLPKLHGLLLEACLVLDLEPPELYVAGAAGVNAYTSGHNHPYIVLHSDLVEVMDDDELLAVIAHELGHVKCQHVLYKEMVRWLTNMGAHGLSRSRLRSSTTQLLVGHVLSALLTWDQRSELSADRAALLVVQDPAPCIRMLLKLAGAPPRLAHELDVDEFLAQARHLQDLTHQSQLSWQSRNRLVKASSHPLTVERARELDAWMRDGGYAKALAAQGTAAAVGG
jgi:Zn-dependent protease with chaperone function